MESALRRTLCALALGLILSVPAAQADTPGASGSALQRAAPQARIYMMRGLLGIFSLGIDQLADKLREQGYQPQIYGWDQWGEVASEIIENNRNGETGQIILIGHSLGSNSTIEVANAVAQQGIPIDLIVTFDITQPLQVPSNVRRFINFYQDNGFGKPAIASPYFRGELQNVDLTADTSLGHISIDKSDRLQQIVIDKIFAVTFEQTKRVAARKQKK